jgi:hypothetical protein
MSHQPDCAGYFLEWAGMVRRDVAPLAPTLETPPRDAGEPETFHLYRCTRCCAAFLSVHPPERDADDGERLGLRWSDL